MTPAGSTIYQHPPAYLLGLEGIALLRAFSGAYDREFTLARIAEIRRLVALPAGVRAARERLPAAALPLGFRVLRCDEPRVPSPLLDTDGRTVHDGEHLPPQDPDEPPSTWALHAETIDATNAACLGKPSSIIWHFRLD